MGKDIDAVVEKARKDKDVLAVSVFGSFARGEKNRDIDICLFLNKGKSKFEMSKKRLEYLSEFNSKLDIQVFQLLPIVIRHRVLKEGKILLCKDIDTLYDMAYAFVKEYEDFMPIYNKYIGVAEHD